MANTIQVPVNQIISWLNPWSSNGKYVTTSNFTLFNYANLEDSGHSGKYDESSAYFQFASSYLSQIQKSNIVKTQLALTCFGQYTGNPASIVSVRVMKEIPLPELKPQYATSNSYYLYEDLPIDPTEFRVEIPIYSEDIYTKQQFPALLNIFNYGIAFFRVVVDDPEDGQGSQIWGYSHLEAEEERRPYLLVEYEPIQLVAADFSPAGSYLDWRQSITFSWGYKHSGENAIELPVPAQSTIEWEEPETSRTGTVTVSGTEQSHTFGAGFFAPGKIRWRVKIDSNDAVEGPYSEWQEFVAVGPPAQPEDFRAIGYGRPLFIWTSYGQAAWRILVQKDGKTVYDTGFVAGAQTKYRCQEYLPYGDCTATLWLRSRFGMDSEPVTTSFEIFKDEYPPPVITATTEENGVRINITSEPTAFYDVYYIFRDGVRVHEIARKQNEMYGLPYEWLDASAGTSHIYFVRGIDMYYDSYVDSSSVWGRAKINHALLSDPRTPQYPLALKLRRGEEPIVEGSMRNQGKSVFYAGRRFPVFEVSEHWSDDLTFGFSLRTRADFDQLQDLIQRGVPLLYRDYRGGRYFLSVTGFEYTSKQTSWDFTINAIKVDYVETVDYFDIPIVEAEL